jgi:NhaP-type Na+/H+ or K+/H+ antiporter
MHRTGVPSGQTQEPNHRLPGGRPTAGSPPGTGQEERLVEHGLDAYTLAVVAACVVVWSFVSGRLERWSISAPIAFLLMGLLVTHGPTRLVHVNPHSSTILSLAEVTLAVVLFTDASRVNIHQLRHDLGLPVRLLAIGLPLTIGVGTATAFGLLPGIGVWVAASVGSIVAPTDAALGSTIMEDRRVPDRIRRLLNVESGLNDGIATPFVNLFLAGAISTETTHSANLTHAVRELLVGVGVGVGIGLAGGWLLSWAVARAWSAPEFRPLAVLGLALLSYGLALHLEGNGFVAAFIAGMAFGSVFRVGLEDVVAFAERVGGLLALMVWLMFGAALVVPGFEAAGWREYVFAVLALTVVRMVPVAASLAGSGLDRSTVALVGWFGPRGLASVVFGLIAYDTLDRAAANELLAVVVVTVTFSVVVHGLSAGPLAARYGRHVQTRVGHGPEHGVTAPFRTRPGLEFRQATRGADPSDGRKDA